MRILTPARVTLLMLLVVGGLIAAYVAKNLLAADETPPEVETRTVPMALADLKPGTIITEAHLGVGRMPVPRLSEHPGMLLENRAIVGRVVKKPIRAGTPITSDQLYQPGELPPLDVKPGMRAVSVSLDGPVALVDGRIAPGQYVDVHMTPTATRGNDDRLGGGLTLTLFQGVRLLAINSRRAQTLGRNNSSSSVTLELTSGQANIMILAANRGDITLSYNPEGPGNGGVGVSREDRATLEEILGLRPREDSSIQVETYKGSSRSTLRFQNGRRVDGPRSSTDNTIPQTQNNPNSSRSRQNDDNNVNNLPKRKSGDKPQIANGPQLGPSI